MTAFDMIDPARASVEKSSDARSASRDDRLSRPSGLMALEVEGLTGKPLTAMRSADRITHRNDHTATRSWEIAGRHGRAEASRC